jgi:hypothetical protein
VGPGLSGSSEGRGTGAREGAAYSPGGDREADPAGGWGRLAGDLGSAWMPSRETVSLTCAAMPFTVNRLTLRFVSDTYFLELQ